MARVRPWLRAIHRDVGYIAVGLTFIYALSGLAVNHLTDWSDGDASFKNYTRTVHVGDSPAAPGSNRPASLSSSAASSMSLTDVHMLMM